MTTAETTYNIEFVTEWIEALESGEFDQGYGQLHSRAGDMCCLGVACELDYRAGGVSRSLVTPRTGAPEQYEYGGGDYRNGETLPPVLLPELGMGDDCGHDIGEWLKDREDEGTALTELNDEANLTFPQIADVLRHHYGLPRAK